MTYEATGIGLALINGSLKSASKHWRLNANFADNLEHPGEDFGI
jgi:hypothetical protein